VSPLGTAVTVPTVLGEPCFEAVAETTSRVAPAKARRSRAIRCRCARVAGA
jgi:hypothetical protein